MRGEVMSKGVISRWGCGCNLVFLPSTFGSDLFVEEVITGSDLIWKMRCRGESLSLFNIQKTSHTVKCGSSTNPSWVLHQQTEFQLSHFDAKSSWRADSFDTGQFISLVPSRVLGVCVMEFCSLQEVLTKSWVWSLSLLWSAAMRDKTQQRGKMMSHSFWRRNGFYLYHGWFQQASLAPASKVSGTLYDCKK